VQHNAPFSDTFCCGTLDDGTGLPATAVMGAHAYQPRAAEGTVLDQVVRDHLETFLREASDRTAGVGLPPSSLRLRKLLTNLRTNTDH